MAARGGNVFLDPLGAGTVRVENGLEKFCRCFANCATARGTGGA